MYRDPPRNQNHTISSSFNPSGDAGDLLQLGVYRAFSTTFNPSGEGGPMLQLGVYRDLKMVWFCYSGEGGGVLQLGVYRDLPRDRNHTFIPRGTRETFYNWVCIGISRGKETILFYQFQFANK